MCTSTGVCVNVLRALFSHSYSFSGVQTPTITRNATPNFVHVCTWLRSLRLDVESVCLRSHIVDCDAFAIETIEFAIIRWMND